MRARGRGLPEGAISGAESSPPFYGGWGLPGASSRPGVPTLNDEESYKRQIEIILEHWAVMDPGGELP